MTTDRAFDRPRRSSEDAYRHVWRWDRLGFGTHCVDCYPANCSFRVYVRDGKVVREEQTGTYRTVEPGVPDMNPMGCQKGASWSQMLDAPERVLYPLKRAGERGEGRWQRVSWDQALTEIADAMLDAIQEAGPQSIVRIGTPGQGGTQSMFLAGAVINYLGGTNTDVQSEINDWNPGLYITFGRFDPCASNDDWFHSDLLLIWANNPAYGTITQYHYLVESRYKGAEVVTIAPDYSPSAIHGDYYLPVRIGSDAALALSMCKVIVDEGLVHEAFVKEQTDLALLVRSDTRRFLRQADMVDGGREDIFYLFDARTGQVVEAPRTLDLAGIDPALEGRYGVTLKDGSSCEVAPAWVHLLERLEQYTPEQAAPLCGCHPEAIRTLARKVATKKTHILLGWTTGKSYHGDLHERSMCLLLALTGNWGKQGAGIRSWAVGMFDGMQLWNMKDEPGQDATRRFDEQAKNLVGFFLNADPTLTEEILMHEQAYAQAATSGTVPSAFFWYNHCGYREIWNNPAWNDPYMKRTFDEYVQEAVEKGWWAGSQLPPPDVTPRVIFEIGGNLLRRQRGGQTMLLRHLWPKVKLFVTIDWRMNTTGLHSDFVLPAAQHYEKPNFAYTVPDIMNLTLSDRVVEPAGESMSEWQIALALAKKVSERAAARGISEVKKGNGETVRLDQIWDKLTYNGYFADEDTVIDEMVKDSAATGTLPPETTLASLRRDGWVRFTGWGRSPMAQAQASDLLPDKTHSPFQWHVRDKKPFPTLTRRAQFYIDHPWFLEADEQLPIHKEPPSIGGNYPFQVTGGHPRWSTNSTNMTNRVILNTHRGRPFIYINDRDAAERGIQDGDDVRVFNDVGSVVVNARVTPACRPGQLIMYNGFEPYQFRDWKDTSNLEAGMVKWLHFAGGYGHLRYRALHWQPVPIDRAYRVEVERAAPAQLDP